MDAWTALRLVKLGAVVVAAGGVVGSIVAPDRLARMQVTHRVLTPAMLVAWVVGYALTKLSGRELHEPWIGLGLLASLVSFHGAVLWSHGERPRRVGAVLAVGGLLAAVGVMVARYASMAWLGGVTLGAFAVGAAIVAALAPRAGAVSPEADRGATWRWFVWVARAEGLSFVALMLIATPLKYAADIHLDGGTGVLGWLHGMLLLVYLQALATTTRLLGWSARDVGLGFAASLLPFGTFWFERRVAPAEASLARAA